MKIALLSGKSVNPSVDNYQNKALIDSAQRRGHTIQLITDNRQPLPLHHQDISILADDLLKVDFDAVIPRLKILDFEAGCLTLEHFEARGLYCLNTTRSLDLARHKFQSLKTLVRHNVPVPRSLWLPKPADVSSFISELGTEKLIIKTNLGSQGKGVMLGGSLAQTRAIVEYLHAVQATFFVQEFIEESSGQDIRVLVLGGQVIGAVKRKAQDPQEFRSNYCLNGSAHAITLTPAQEKLALDATQSHGLIFAGIDLIVGKNQTYVLEVNGNPGFEAIDHVYQTQTADRIIQHLEDHIR